MCIFSARIENLAGKYHLRRFCKMWPCGIVLRDFWKILKSGKKYVKMQILKIVQIAIVYQDMQNGVLCIFFFCEI